MKNENIGENSEILGVSDSYDKLFLVFYGENGFAFMFRNGLLELLADDDEDYVKYKPEKISEGTFLFKSNSRGDKK